MSLYPYGRPFSPFAFFLMGALFSMWGCSFYRGGGGDFRCRWIHSGKSDPEVSQEEVGEDGKSDPEVNQEEKSTESFSKHNIFDFEIKYYFNI